MRASRYYVALYAGMVGVPLLLLLIAVCAAANYRAAVAFLSILLIVALVAYGITGIGEMYHGAYPGSGNPISYSEERKGGSAPARASGTRVRIVLDRFNPSTGRLDKAAYESYADKRTTVLDAMLSIRDYQDNTVSVRCNCRMGICGSCGMVVNGKPVLACEANLLKTAEAGEVEVSPMLGHPLLKDTVTDFKDFFERHKSVEPYLDRKDRKEQYSAKEEYRQSAEELCRYLPYSYCIMCGLCLDACPVVNLNPNFIGPQALSQVYRYHEDSRDQKGKRRLFDVDSAEGVWGCEFSGSCSKACPKGVDPASAIQMLKGDLMKRLADSDG